MILAAAAGLGSCSAVRHCKAPEVDFPAAIAGGAAADSLAIADMEWWRFYGDSTLCNADRFPRIVFNLTGGWENNDVSGFFRSPFSYVAGTLASPVFGFGRKQARYKAALAAYDEARLGYEQKVLTVFKEANDAVVSYRSVRRTAALKVNLRDAARKYVELAQLQYRGGSINYIDVLDAQRRYFDAQIGVSNAVRDEHLALVDLYKALGGGWAGITLPASLVYRYARIPADPGFYFRDAVSGKMSRKLFLPCSYETSFPGKVLTAGP